MKTYSQPMSVSRFIKYLLSILLYGSVLYFGFIILNQHFDRKTPDTVFVYGSLLNSWERTITCRCISQVNPATLRDYTLEENIPIVSVGYSIEGGFVQLTREEHERLATRLKARGATKQIEVRWQGVVATTYVAE